MPAAETLLITGGVMSGAAVVNVDRPEVVRFPAASRDKTRYSYCVAAVRPLRIWLWLVTRLALRVVCDQGVVPTRRYSTCVLLGSLVVQLIVAMRLPMPVAVIAETVG